MAFSKTITKIQKEFETELESLDSIGNHLQSLDLQGFEEVLFKQIIKLYETLSETLIREFTSSEFYKNLSEKFAETKGGAKLRERDTNLQIRTGKFITFPNYYIENPVKKWQGPRHLFHALFGTISKTSPSYLSTVSMFSVVCPSFEVASEILQSQCIETNYDRVRDLSLKVGKECLSMRVGIQLKEGETLAGKGVIVSIDGGRSRMREEKEELNKAGTHHLFNTPWREPKLFVIHILDEETGKQSKTELPIYDCTFGDDESFELLGKYLQLMEVDKAKKVQFIADGATWIWNRAKPMLEKLGVKPENIIETLDYYHATEHLSAILQKLPKRIDKEERANLFKQLKNLLWEGKIFEIENKIKTVVKRTNKAIRREIKYLKKHKERCRYSFFKENKMLCGSGIIESGIRRIINLRFKSPSSFWIKENLEPLIFLRATLLSKRWVYMIQNLVKSEKKKWMQISDLKMTSILS